MAERLAARQPPQAGPTQETFHWIALKSAPNPTFASSSDGLTRDRGKGSRDVGSKPFWNGLPILRNLARTQALVGQLSGTASQALTQVRKTMVIRHLCRRRRDTEAGLTAAIAELPWLPV